MRELYFDILLAFIYKFLICSDHILKTAYLNKDTNGYI